MSTPEDLDPPTFRFGEQKERVEPEESDEELEIPTC